jgi:exodeoxyribonuclease VII small subunit
MAMADDMPAYDSWEATLLDGSFEDSLDALRDVVSRLETGQLPLSDSVRCYEYGARLARRCKRLLDEAELTISTIDGENDNGHIWDGELLT